MTLVPNSSSQGLFHNDAWTPGSPGLFCVLIGVSAYDHLDGTRRSYGLDQLTVSALTAYRVLLWLENTYRYDDAPLAQCWVLLSPTPAEREFAASDMGFAAAIDHAMQPTLANCTTAIRAWHDTAERLPKRVATKCRLMFFFSGHGLEFTEEKQILLPSDYLESGVLDDAVSVANIRGGCGPLFVRDQFFFIDACRNDHEELRAANISGARILQEWGSSKLNPDRNSALLYASASGTRAFSPLTPDKGCSIYGQALLEGFLGTPDLRLDCDKSRCAVTVYPLHNFMKRRVLTLLAANGGTVLQRIPFNGPIVDEPIVTYIPASNVPPPAATPGGPVDPLSVLPDRLPDAIAPAATALGVVGVSHAELFAPHSQPHNTFGSETITGSWEKMRVFSLEHEEWTSADEVRFYRVRRDEGPRIYRIQLSARGSSWLQVTLPEWSPLQNGFAAILPDPDHESPIYEIDIFRDDEGRFVSVDVFLAHSNAGAASVAAALWQTYQTGPPRAALQSASMKALSKEPEGALATVIASLVFLRAGRPFPRWLRKRVDRRQLTDATVLWFEAEGDAKYTSDEKVRTLLEAITRRGLPFLNESFGYLDRQVERIADVEAHDLWMDHDLKSQLRDVQEQIGRMMRFFRPGGLTGTFISGDPSALSPYLVLPQASLFTAPPRASEGSAGAMMAG